MSGRLPPAPPDDDDRERAWIVEGLRQALGRATARELTRLTSLLEPVADGEGNVAGWLVMLFADEMGRQFVPLDSSVPGARRPTPTAGASRRSASYRGSGPGPAHRCPLSWRA